MKTLTWVDQWKDSGSPLTQEEIQFLGYLVEFIDECIEEEILFPLIIGTIDFAMRGLSASDYDFTRAKERGLIHDWKSRLAKLKKQRAAHGGLTSEEVEFLKDLRGFIEYAIRNGLTLLGLVGPIVHDCNEFARDDWEFKAATKRGFLPMVSRYAKISPDSVQSGEDE